MEALLCREEAVDVALVVLDDPLPLLQLAPQLSSVLGHAINHFEMQNPKHSIRVGLACLPIRIEPSKDIVVSLWVRGGRSMQKLPARAIHLDTAIEVMAAGRLVTLKDTKRWRVRRSLSCMKVIGGRFPPRECIRESRHVGGVEDVVWSTTVHRSEYGARGRSFASTRDAPS